MTYRDAFVVLLVAALALFSLAGVAASGYGASAVHAQSDGFDALANRMFGGNTCSREAR